MKPTVIQAQHILPGGEESFKVVRIMDTTKVYAISTNNGHKAPFTLYFEQEIETNFNGRGIVLKGSGLAVDLSNRKTALQNFTRERLIELKLDDLVKQAEDAEGELVTITPAIEASELYGGYPINISIVESVTPREGSQNMDPKRAGEDGPVLTHDGQPIYVDRFIVAGAPTYRFLQHEEFKKNGKSAF